jgi:hypothetical protein
LPSEPDRGKGKGLTAQRVRAPHGAPQPRLKLLGKLNPRSIQMPVILWLLGVPLTIVLLLVLFGVL